jgi:hypothetical protein
MLVKHYSEVSLIPLASRHLRPRLKKIIINKRTKYENTFYSIISEGLSEKIFKEHKPKEAIGVIIMGAVFNYYLWDPVQLKGDQEGRIKGFADFFLEGLRA